jgi:hypothetical protein
VLGERKGRSRWGKSEDGRASRLHAGGDVVLKMVLSRPPSRAQGSR